MLGGMVRIARSTAAPDAGRPLLYSKTCQQALRTMERVATIEAANPGAWVPQARVAEELEISGPSLGQIVHRLRKAGLLRARRGPSGGVGLSREPEEITVRDVVEAIDGTGVSERCLLGLPACSDKTPCPVHPVWKVVRPMLESRLEESTIADLVDAMEKKGAKGKKAPARKAAARRK
ncbi:Rrf2 family transcriptional regulator [Acidobacteria bacterium ACD]|nr:MAG: Rrf2 family transcriptional regulator [Acidobacteriota bacterium]MDL1949677.1 Rrf2 family transcriptional regulator [Acidobacteria bacterium ACD]